MAEINFVADSGNQKPKKDDSGEQQIRWSEAERPAAKPGVLAFFKDSAAPAPGSRDEAMRLIKSYVKEKEAPPLVDSAAPQVELTTPVQAPRPTGRILEINRHDEGAPPPEPAGPVTGKTDAIAIFFKRLFNRKHKPAGGGHILATNLISGETTAVFDWRKNVPVFIFWLVLSGLILAGVFQALVVWEEKKVAEANTNTEKFGALRIQIAQEERGVEEILDLQKKLEVIKKLLDRHIYWSNFFVFLEKNTLADVSFNGFGGDTKGLYSLAGLAKNFKTLADQLITLKADKLVTWVGSRGGSAGIDKAGNGLITFDLQLLVKKELFNKEIE